MDRNDKIVIVSAALISLGSVALFATANLKRVRVIKNQTATIADLKKFLTETTNRNS